MKYILFILTCSILTACNEQVINEEVSNTIGNTTTQEFIIGDMVLCMDGDPEIIDGDSVYSETCIYDCNKADTIHQWWALDPSEIYYANDTLSIRKRFLLPIGNNFDLVWKPFFITDVYQVDGTIKKNQYFLIDEDNYTEKEIKHILSAYEKADSTTFEWNSLNYLDICYQLFWAYVSGNMQAKAYLLNAKNKFAGFSGHVAEEYADLIRTIKEIEESDIKKNK